MSTVKTLLSKNEIPHTITCGSLYSSVSISLIKSPTYFARSLLNHGIFFPDTTKTLSRVALAERIISIP